MGKNTGTVEWYSWLTFVTEHFSSVEKFCICSTCGKILSNTECRCRPRGLFDYRADEGKRIW